MTAVKCLSVHHFSADYIFCPVGLFSSFSYLKLEFRFSRCYGHCRCCTFYFVLHILFLVMNRLNKTEVAIFISLMWTLLPWDLTYQNLFGSTLTKKHSCEIILKSIQASIRLAVAELFNYQKANDKIFLCKILV